jgi:translation elongation factor P/translation initiation factor 5A
VNEMIKKGNVVEYDNLKWRVRIAERVYPENKYSSKTIVAQRILKSGKLGKENIAYNSDRMLTSIHRYKR